MARSLPFARTVGSRPARIFGVNSIGLMRRGLPTDVIEKLKRSFRYLTQSKMNTTKALQKIEGDKSLACDEVRQLIDFIRTSRRGVILRRATRKAQLNGFDQEDGPGRNRRQRKPDDDGLHHDIGVKKHRPRR